MATTATDSLYITKWPRDADGQVVRPGNDAATAWRARVDALDGADLDAFICEYGDLVETVNIEDLECRDVDEDLIAAFTAAREADDTAAAARLRLHIAAWLCGHHDYREGVIVCPEGVDYLVGVYDLGTEVMLVDATIAEH